MIFISGDDADAKADVVALFEEAGFAPIDLGDLATGGAMQQIHHSLAGVDRSDSEERRRLTFIGAIPRAYGDGVAPASPSRR